SEYAAYVDWLEADRAALAAWSQAVQAHIASGSEDPAPSAPQLHTAEIQAYEAKARAVAQGIRQAADDASLQHASLLEAARQELEAAETLNSRIAALSREAANAAPSGSG